MSQPVSSINQRHISIELTRRCNNSCRHCYNFWRKDGQADQERSEEVLSRAQVRCLVEKVKQDIGLEYVGLSGGEPLLRSDFPGIVCDLVDDGLQPIVVTNGVLLTASLLRRLPQGIHFEVTLLGHTASLHNRLAGARVFKRVIENLARISRHGSYFTLVFVATKLNALDVLRTVELGIALGARGVMYNRVNLSNGMKPYLNDLVPSADLLAKSLHLAQDAARKYDIQVACSVPIPACLLDIAQYPQLHFGWCPRGGEQAYYTVGPTGLLRPCNHSSVVLGDLQRQGFAEIVSGQACRDFWQAVPKECIDCQHPLKDECKGGCPAAADEFYGPPRRIDPICELASKKRSLNLKGASRRRNMGSSEASTESLRGSPTTQ